MHLTSARYLFLTSSALARQPMGPLLVNHWVACAAPLKDPGEGRPPPRRIVTFLVEWPFPGLKGLWNFIQAGGDEAVEIEPTLLFGCGKSCTFQADADELQELLHKVV